MAPSGRPGRDPLASALAREVLAELEAPPSPERDVYLCTMMNALKAHILRKSVAGALDDLEG